MDDKHNNAAFISDKEVGVAQSEFLREKNVNLLWIVPVTCEIKNETTPEPPRYDEVEEKIAKKDIVFGA